MNSEDIFIQPEKNFKEILNRGIITYYCALCSMIVLPVHFQYLPPFLVAWTVFWILEKKIDRKIPGIVKLIFISFLVFYLFQVVGLIYSEDKKMAFSNLYGRLSLILFPLVLAFSGELIRRRVVYLLRTFALGTLMYLVICFLYGLYRSLTFTNGELTFNPHPQEYFYLSYFYGEYLTLFQHPSYVAMYVVFSSFISFEAFFDNSLIRKYRVLWILIAVLFLVSLFFISSRAGILAAIILIPIYFLFKFQGKKRRFVLFLGTILLLGLSMPLLLKNQRVLYLYSKITHKETVGENREEPRFIIWRSASKLICENFLGGVGIGDVRSELAQEYKNRGHSEMVKLRLNAHNQFIEILLESGILGLTLFLFILSIMIYSAILQNNLLYGIFIIMMIVFFMFESILYRLAGVSFFSMFSLIMAYYKPLKS